MLALNLPLRLRSLTYVVGSAAIGLGLAAAGPSLALLEHQVGVGTGAIGLVFTAEGVGYLTGSQLLARGYDRGIGHRLQGGAMLVAALALASIPEARSLSQLALSYVVVGLAIGTADVGSNTHLVWAHGDRSGSWIAALHLGFGVGALASPLLARWSEAAYGTVSLTFRVPAFVAAVVGVTVFLSAGPVSTHAPSVGKAPSRRRPPRGLALLIAFAFVYVGLEVSFTSWLNTYGRGIGFSPGAAAALNSVFWIAYIVGRTANLYIARWATDFRPLVLAAVGPVIGAALLLPLSHGGGWAGVIVIGVTVGPQFPLLIALVGRRGSMSGSSMAWFFGGGGLGGLSWPWLVGQLIDRSGPRALPAAIIGLGTVCMVLVVLGARSFDASTESGTSLPSDPELGVHHGASVGFVTDETDSAVGLAAVHEQHELARGTTDRDPRRP